MAQVAIVLGTDSIVYSMSSTGIADLGEDEIDFAGGFMGKPVELVKCETSDILVPANAEMIIEGEVPTGEMEEDLAPTVKCSGTWEVRKRPSI